MALLQLLAGSSLHVFYDFFTPAGVRTPVDNPVARLYTPDRSLFQQVAITLATTGVTGQYTYGYDLPAGVTLGHWGTFATGTTNGSFLLSNNQTFSIVDFAVEPIFIGVQDLRDYLGVLESDHTKDDLYKRLILSSVSIIEQYLRRKICVHSVSETIRLQQSSVIILKDYPVISISGMTVSDGYIGATSSTPNSSYVDPDNLTTDFHFSLNKSSGIMNLIDENGFESQYCDTFIEIDYEAGYMTVPESLRIAILMLASGMLNVSQSEGLSSVRFNDLAFVFSKGLITDYIKDAIDSFRNVSLR